MINKCSLPGCLTKHAIEEKVNVFEMPKDKEFQFKPFSLLKGDKLETQEHVFVCYKHFANNFVKNNG